MKEKKHSNILNKVTYSGSEKKKIDEIFKRLFKEADYVGEDGNMVCASTSERGAMIKFRRRVREDVGEIDADEMVVDSMGFGYLLLVDEKNENHQHMVGESEWYINWGGTEVSDYKVYVYHY